MAIDYEKLDNWEKAKTIFGKIIGKADYEKVNKKLKLFTEIEKIIAASDKAAADVIKGQKKNNLIPENAQKIILDNNKLIPEEGQKLTKALDANLDDKYDEAIEQLISELYMYTSVYASMLKSNMNGKKEDLAKLQLAFSKSEFLQAGSFDKIFEKGEKALQVVARALREYADAAKKDKDAVTEEDSKKLYKIYNETVPGNSNGMRSITTFLKSFVDYETYFEKYKITSTEFKKLQLHSDIKEYDRFREYTKGAVIFIKKLTPWATSQGNVLTSQHIEEKAGTGPQAVIKDIAERLMAAKHTFIQAKTFFIKLF